MLWNLRIYTYIYPPLLYPNFKKLMTHHWGFQFKIKPDIFLHFTYAAWFTPCFSIQLGKCKFGVSTFRPLKRAENSWSFRWRWTAKIPKRERPRWADNTIVWMMIQPIQKKNTLEQVKVDQFGNLTVFLRVENWDEIIETITSIVYHGNHADQTKHTHTHIFCCIFFGGRWSHVQFRLTPKV